ncbi:hypothetical protein CR513_16231, partial [Mucuna pruriens]
MPYVPPYQPRADAGVATTPRPTQQGVRRPLRMLTAIPTTYTKLLPRLLEQKLVEIVPLKPLVPPYLRSYDPNVRCDYHGGVVGHATERCWILKHKDQGLDVQSNPLLAHRSAVVNAISHENRERTESFSRRGGSLTAWPSW